MDLLETVLRSAQAEKYIETFKNNKIEANTLPLLTDVDLQLLGVDEEPLRDEILKKASHVCRKFGQVVLTREDVNLILNQIAYQLNLHHALLSCAVIRKDVVVCDIKLGNATRCLLRCVESLEEQVDEFEGKKIGVGLTGFGMFFLFLGVLMLFDKSLLALGNVLFISGLSCVIGLERTFRFFFQRHKVKASLSFFGGIIVVLTGWPLIGMLFETYGFVLLFSGFFPVAINFIRRVPVLGTILNLPGISMLVDKLTGDSKRTMV